jgi:hypothetical protein
MSTVPEVGVCCKVTISGRGATRTRWLAEGSLSEVVYEALHLTGLADDPAEEFTITVKREGHDA